MRTTPRVLAIAATTLVLAAGGLHAQVDLAKVGPPVGERAVPFELRDQDGRPQTLESLAGPNGTMLVFTRSADW
jgi:hypothetical protein